MLDMEPFLRWVGSKRWIRHRIAKLILHHIKNEGTYFEPFIGSCAVFLSIELPTTSHLIDAIPPLIYTLQAIKNDPISVYRNMRSHVDITPVGDEQAYIKARDRFNHLLSTATFDHECAGLFLLLNAACYNGLWRTNQNGLFNVPMGDKQRYSVPRMADLIHASKLFQKSEIYLSSGGNETLQYISDRAKKGDVIFADPPYAGKFNDYDETFGLDVNFQSKLASSLEKISRRGTTVITMNSWNKETVELYSPFCELEKIKRHQGVAGVSDRRGTWDQMLATSVGSVSVR